MFTYIYSPNRSILIRLESSFSLSRAFDHGAIPPTTCTIVDQYVQELLLLIDPAVKARRPYESIERSRTPSKSAIEIAEDSRKSGL